MVAGKREKLPSLFRFRTTPREDRTLLLSYLADLLRRPTIWAFSTYLLSRSGRHEPRAAFDCQAKGHKHDPLLELSQLFDGLAPKFCFLQMMLTTCLATSREPLYFGPDWPLGACLIVFLGMLAWMRLVQGRVQECGGTLLFKMQSHCIAGSLLSASATLVLQVTSFVKSATKGLSSQHSPLQAWWFPLVLCVVPNNKHRSNESSRRCCSRPHANPPTSSRRCWIDCGSWQSVSQTTAGHIHHPADPGRAGKH
jgi:hypothetical protein